MLPVLEVMGVIGVVIWVIVVLSERWSLAAAVAVVCAGTLLGNVITRPADTADVITAVSHVVRALRGGRSTSQPREEP